jgi:hypothetical protein
VIPATWVPHRREDDGELLGYLEPAQDDFQARTVFGYPIGEPGGRLDAERALDAAGLSYLAERWLLSLPGREEPVSVLIVEVTPSAVTVQSVDYGYEGDIGTPLVLEVPTSADELRPERAL